MDTLVKTVGLLVSVVFFAVAAWFALSGKLDEASQTTITFFYVLVVFFGGPILYFYVGSAASFEWKSPIGKFSVTDANRTTLRLHYWMNRPTSEWAADMVAELSNPSVPDWPGCEGVRLQATELLGYHFLYVLPKGETGDATWFFEEFSHRVRRGDPSLRVRFNNLLSMGVAYERMKSIPRPPDFVKTVVRETLGPFSNQCVYPPKRGHGGIGQTVCWLHGVVC